ncbi:MAG: hypothetical protein HY308_01520 [Gammaproteobacteria bacterium]|nr:hypothetical protein [Gammaproteobacteria bacterium]
MNNNKPAFLHLIRWAQLGVMLGIAMLLPACGGGGSGDDSNNSPPPPADAFAVTVVDSGTYTGTDGNHWNYQLLRVPNAAGGFTYLQWFPPPAGKPAGVIVSAMPYEVIDWTGEAVDARWAAKPDDLCPPNGAGLCYDLYGPNFVAGGAPRLGSTLAPPSKLGNDASIYLSQGFAVLGIFGRYYAGGDVWNDIQDAVAGMRFLETRSDIDKTRIGVFGFSWGGFEALYGAAYSPSAVTPKAGVVLGAPTDFAKMLDHIRGLSAKPELAAAPTVLADYQGFFDAYVRRIRAASGGWPGEVGADFSRFDTAAVAQRLRSRVLLVSDEWDTLVPYAMVRDLGTAAPTQTEGLWYKHFGAVNYADPANKLSHGPMSRQIGFPSFYTFTLGYLLTQLGDNGQPLTVVYDARDMDCFLVNVRGLQRRAASQEDVDARWLVSRLLDLADSRVKMVDVTSVAGTLQSRAGNDFVADAITRLWSTPLTAQTVENYLRTRGTMPPPGTGAISGCEIP